MAPDPANADRRRSAFDAVDPPEEKQYLECIHCGFCLPACPTYLEMGNEMDSPRGRVYLIRMADEGKIGITESFVTHIEACLVCRACETACPSGVQFGSLMEKARGHIHRNYPYGPAERRLRRFLLQSFTDVRRLGTLTSLLRLYQRSGLQTLVRASGVLGLFGRLGKMEALLPPIPDHRAYPDLPEVIPAAGMRRGRVGLLAGCAQRYFLPQVNRAAARVLTANGFEVVNPRNQGCCGSLHVHEGEREHGRECARRIIDVFERADIDWVLVNAAGCGGMMKRYGELFLTDPGSRQRAEALAAKVRDASELLAQADVTGSLGTLALTVTYHDACHLAHGQKVRAGPRKLLAAIPGIRLVEMAESDFCCGSAGIYNLLHPDLAQKFLDRKIDRIQATGADVVVSANPGCTFQIGKGLKERGLGIRILHPMELLEEAYRGGMSPRT